MNPISQLCPVTDSRAARLVQDDTMAALADDIVRSGMAPFAGGALPAAERARPAGARRQRLLIGVPVAVALAVAGLIATSLGTPGQHLGPVNVGPPKAEAAALSFTRQHGYIRVIVRNPVADPEAIPSRVRREPPQHHAHACPGVPVSRRHAGRGELVAGIRHADHAHHGEGQVLHRRWRQRVPGGGQGTGRLPRGRDPSIRPRGQAR